MKRVTFRLQKTIGLAVVFALAMLLCVPVVASDSKPGDRIVIFLVRHAETLPWPDDGTRRDPHLNEAGRQRAASLADSLVDAGVTTVFSSDFLRTKETAAPLAERLGLEVTHYDPGELADLADKLRETPGRHLVAGHSNTTPQLVELLGGDPGMPIDDGWEFDRLYIVTLDPSGSVSTVLLRYGERSTEDGATGNHP